jgi:L-ascorbate metabolism protein UlaG (beta-lactamase superfamily)
LCLITHGHADHFEPTAVVEIGCAVAGPNEVQALVPKSFRAADGPVWNFSGAEIRCVPTEHAAIPHCSYFISWHGIRIFVSGDIESLDVVNESGHPFDVIFLPSWLIPEVDNLDRMYSDADVIVHHHRAEGETLPACSKCITPAQGATTEIKTK